MSLQILNSLFWAQEAEEFEAEEVGKPLQYHAKDRQVEDCLRESLRASPHYHATSGCDDDDPTCLGMGGNQGIACTSGVEAVS